MKRKTIKDEVFDEIYRTYRDDVYKVSYYYTKDAHAAEDIAQKVFYQFYLHYDNVNEDSLRSYLIHSARNLSFNWFRDKRREVHGEYLDVLPEEDMPHYSAEEEYIIDEQSQERELFVGNLLKRLREENESWYQIVNLIFFLEKPHDEVAEELEITKDVLYSKLYRAKKWLRKNFEEEYKNL